MQFLKWCIMYASHLFGKISHFTSFILRVLSLLDFHFIYVHTFRKLRWLHIRLIWSASYWWWFLGVKEQRKQERRHGNELHATTTTTTTTQQLQLPKSPRRRDNRPTKHPANTATIADASAADVNDGKVEHERHRSLTKCVLFARVFLPISPFPILPFPAF